MHEKAVHHGVHRNLTHISTVVCIFAIDESMPLFLVSSQATQTVEKVKSSKLPNGCRLDIGSLK